MKIYITVFLLEGVTCSFVREDDAEANKAVAKTLRDGLMFDDGSGRVRHYPAHMVGHVDVSADPPDPPDTRRPSPPPSPPPIRKP